MMSGPYAKCAGCGTIDFSAHKAGCLRATRPATEKVAKDPLVEHPRAEAFVEGEVELLGRCLRQR